MKRRMYQYKYEDDVCVMNTRSGLGLLEQSLLSCSKVVFWRVVQVFESLIPWVYFI
jgi:hypothetical protein